MKKFFLNLLDENSAFSSMRFMSIASLGIAGLIAIVSILTSVFTTVDLTGVSLIISIFVGGAFGGKVLQKGHEVKEELSTSEADKKISTSTVVDES